MPNDTFENWHFKIHLRKVFVFWLLVLSFALVLSLAVFSHFVFCCLFLSFGLRSQHNKEQNVAFENENRLNVSRIYYYCESNRDGDREWDKRDIQYTHTPLFMCVYDIPQHFWGWKFLITMKTETKEREHISKAIQQWAN